MAIRYVFAINAPLRSRAGQNRTWWPQGPAQPLVTSADCPFLVGSLDSPSL